VNLAVVSDELTEDLEDAIRAGLEMGIARFELRKIWGSRVPAVSREELARVKALKKRTSIQIPSISPGLFKIPLNSEKLEEHRMRLLEQSLAFAEELEVERIIIFGFMPGHGHDPSDGEKVLDLLGEAARAIASRGIAASLENEPGPADTSDHLLRIFTALEGSGLKLNWDPGNLFKAGETDYRSGYAALRSHIDNVHVKDAIRTPDGCRHVALGEGEIDWASQIGQLEADGYTGNLVIETHCKPLIEMTRRNVEFIRKVLAH